MTTTKGTSSGTYPDRLILGSSREQLAVWAKTYAPNVQIVRVVRSFVDQNAVQQVTISIKRPVGQDMLRNSNQVLAPVLVS